MFYFCLNCKKRTKALRIHMKHVRGRECCEDRMLTEFSCGQPLCGRNFPSSETLRNHLMSDHSHDDICNE